MTATRSPRGIRIEEVAGAGDRLQDGAGDLVEESMSSRHRGEDVALAPQDQGGHAELGQLPLVRLELLEVA